MLKHFYHSLHIVVLHKYGQLSIPFLLNPKIDHHISNYIDIPDFVAPFLSALCAQDFDGRASITPLALELYLKSRQWMFDGHLLFGNG